MSSGIGLNYLGQFQNALNEVAKVMDEGEDTHKKDEWMSTGSGQHLKHALDHIVGTHKGDDILYESLLEDVGHAATRCLMALELILRVRNGN